MGAALLEQGYEPELTDGMKAELDQRIEDMDQDPNSGVPWEEAKARLLRKFRE